MNKIKDPSEVTIGDLRQLGREGGTTARLESGEIVELSSRYGIVSREGIVAGEKMQVKVIQHYVDIYSQIRTIKRNGILIARRSKFGKDSALRLTGKGYHRSSPN